MTTTDCPTAPQGEPCTARDLNVSLTFVARAVPYGVEPKHLREYMAAWIEDREPNLDEDILDAIHGVTAEMVSSLPKLPAPQGRPCPRCGDFGYLITEHEAPCPDCSAGQALARKTEEKKREEAAA